MIEIKDHNGKTVDFIFEDMNTVTIYFTDGTQLRVKACCCLNTDGED